MRAPDGEPLTIDIAWLGSPDATRALVHSCGLHGIEGFAGSAIQLALLENGVQPPEGTALVLVNVLNPFGMAWLRRVNERNVDLNRNFLVGAERYGGASEAYRRICRFLNPASPARPDFFYLRAAGLVLRHGLGTLRQAIAEGQYEFPRGIFFGGAEIQRGPAWFIKWIERHLSNVTRAVALDVHTGLGAWGAESIFLDGAGSAQGLSRSLHRPVIGKGVGGVRYEVRGGYASAFRVLDRGKTVPVLTQEFGSYSSVRVLHALREENRQHHYGGGAIEHPAKARLKEMFAPRSQQWRERVVERGVSLAQDALRLVAVD